MKDYSSTKIGIIGCGFMGSSIITAVSKEVSGKNIYLYDTSIDKTNDLANKLQANAATDISALLTECRYIFLAVKPNCIASVVEQISKTGKGKPPVIISIAAGVKLEKIRKQLKTSTFDQTPFLIRLMPNLPASVEQGMIALAIEEENTNNNEYNEHINFVKTILTYSGKVEQVSENLMDAVTAISGSGPAYAFMFIEALADAAVRLGFTRKQAYIYAAQTLKGSAEMVLTTGKLPAELKDAVCSPAGTTIEAVKVLEDKGFRSAIIEAASAACTKSAELGKK